MEDDLREYVNRDTEDVAIDKCPCGHPMYFYTGCKDGIVSDGLNSVGQCLGKRGGCKCQPL